MKFFKLFIMISVAVTIACCSNGSNTAVQRTEADAARKSAKCSKDSTLIVVLESTKGDSVVVTNSETQRKYTLSVSQLMQDRENHGSLTLKSKLAVMVDVNKKTIYKYINLTELAGLWLFSDNSGNGVRFDENGAASNIGEVDDITLRTWHVQNGRIKLAYVLSDGSDYQEKEEEATIVSLSAEQLIFLFRGHQYVCNK